MKKPTSLTDKQARFVRAYVQRLISMQAAAEEAGYADPSSAVQDLKANADVMLAVAELQRAERVTWKQGVLKAMKTLSESMDPLVVAWDEKKQEYIFVGMKPNDRIMAAGKFIDAVKASNPEVLMEKAEKEDKATRSEAVAEILGAEIPDSDPVPTVPPSKTIQ